MAFMPDGLGLRAAALAEILMSPDAEMAFLENGPEPLLPAKFQTGRKLSFPDHPSACTVWHDRGQRHGTDLQGSCTARHRSPSPDETHAAFRHSQLIL